MKPKVHIKIISIFILTCTLNLSIVPLQLLALTNGPIQVDYTGYESGSTDMVNLMTGDFTYSIPVLSIPSPEGGFSFPISYHSGIQLDQEASWVGLGWSLNVGAINRTVSQFPDDFHGQESLNHYTDPGGYGWNYNFLLGTTTYNTEKGKGGSVNLGIIEYGWGTSAGFTALGVSFKRGEYTSVNPIKLFSAIVSIVSAGAAAGVVEVLKALGQVAISEIATNAITQTIVAATSSGGKTLNVNDWTQTTPSKEIFNKNEYLWFLNKIENEEMYGSLYLGEVVPDNKTKLISHPTFIHQSSTAANPLDINNYAGYLPPVFNEEVSTDVHMNFSGDDLGHNSEPSHVAYDNYQVMGSGVSGAIKPYRHDIGSLAYPYRFGQKHYRYNLIKYIPEEDYASVTGYGKVNFNYVGEIANEYRNHVTPSSGNDLSKLENGLEMTFAKSFSFSDEIGLHLTIHDDKLLDLSSTKLEADRNNPLEGLKNNHLTESKFIKWYSNKEILKSSDNVPFNEGFIDMEYTDIDTKMDSKMDFRGERTSSLLDDIDTNGIGGFMVVRADGTTYHYSLPVYNNTEYSYNGNQDDSKRTTRYNKNSYATTWLLTAITGPDFYDRGGGSGGEEPDGIIGAEDWGRWVKFEYNQFENFYRYRSPYNTKYQYSPGGKEEEYSYNFGEKEIYYLDKIQTRTHTAVFIKNERYDGRSHYTFDSGDPNNNTYPKSKLRLDEVILLKNEDFEELKQTYNFSRDNGGDYNVEVGGVETYKQLKRAEKIDNVYDVHDISASARTFIQNHQIRRVTFNYDYSLCAGTYNSFEITGTSATNLPDINSATAKEGKLALKSVSVYGKEDYKVVPDYSFAYSNKVANFHPAAWDQWGMYYPNALDAHYGHDYLRSELTNRDEDYWNLIRITTPSGSEIDIAYERDQYSEVSGVKIDQFQKTIWAKATNVNTTTKEITFNTNIDLEDYLSIGTISINDWYADNNNNVSGNYTITDIDNNTITLSSFSEHVISHGTSSDIDLYISFNFDDEGNKDGGDLRVKSITISDQLYYNNSFSQKSEYSYQRFDNPNITSGVISLLPIWSRNPKVSYLYHDFYDYPFTPVYYKNVTVKNNVKSNGSYTSKSEYVFETPHHDKYALKEENIDYKYRTHVTKLAVFPYLYDYEVNINNYNIYSNLASIGRINSIKKYNSRDHMIHSAEYEYVDQKNFPDNQSIPGLRTEGSWMTYRVINNKKNKFPHILYHSYFNRTNKIMYPNVLSRVNINQDNYSYSTENTKYDFITGAILEQEYRNSLGYLYKSVVTQAHDFHHEMDSKVEDINNKNMMSQSSGNYLYVWSVKDEDWLPINAAVQTWSEDPSTDVWRKEAMYVWNSEIEKDGVYSTNSTAPNSDYTTFTHSIPHSPPSGWQKLGESTRYNNFSFPIEKLSANGYYSAVKKDNTNVFMIASVENSRYGEFTYSGAENDLNPDNEYDGGLTKTGSVDIQPNIVGPPAMTAHTGYYVYKLPNNSSLNFITDLGTTTNPVPQDKVYRLSFWQHRLNFDQSPPVLTYANWGGTSWNTSGEVDVLEGYARLDTGAISLDLGNRSNCADSNRFGMWYLVEVDVPVSVPNVYELRLYLENEQTDPIYIDDYRFLPIDATIKCNVFDNQRGDGRILAWLNDSHHATCFEYFDNSNFKLEKIKSVKKEFSDEICGGVANGGFKLMTSKDYNILDHN